MRARELAEQSDIPHYFKANTSSLTVEAHVPIYDLVRADSGSGPQVIEEVTKLRPMLPLKVYLDFEPEKDQTFKIVSVRVQQECAGRVYPLSFLPCKSTLTSNSFQLL